MEYLLISLGDNAVGTRLKQELQTFCKDARPHQAIMPERKLAERYGISHGSVRRVLEDLTSAGLIYKVQGGNSSGGFNYTVTDRFGKEFH